MFWSEGPDNYEKVYHGLVERLAKADLAGNAEPLGLAVEGDNLRVPMLGRDYLVGPGGVAPADGGEAAMTHRIVLAYYAMHGGRGEPAGRFAPYRELPGGADFARSLSQMVEGRLAPHFSGRAGDLRQAAAAMGGRDYDPGTSFDAAHQFEALPRLPMAYTFYDADEDFPAEAKVFYDLTAPNFLDMECLAVLGLILVMELEANDPGAAA